MTIGHWVTIGIVLFGLIVNSFVGYFNVKNQVATQIAVVKTKIEHLKEKQDKHNNLMERLAKVESSTASAHHRLDDHCDQMHNNNHHDY